MVRVSVVIIFYNEERFLGEAIASVRAQTYRDWELILVDDGSTDRSPQIAYAAASEDPRVRMVTHPNGENRGMSASRNRGVTEASGEFVAFLDGDDVWAPEKLAEQVAIFDDLPQCEMIYGRTVIWHSWDKAAPKSDYCQDLGVEPNRLHEPPTLYRLLMRNRAQAPTTNNAIMRRTLIERVGGFEDSFRAMFEDQVFYVKTHLTARCYVADRTWAFYRQHAASHTARTRMRRELAELARFLRWVGRYLARHHPGQWSLRPPLVAAKVDCRVRQARALVGWALGRE